MNQLSIIKEKGMLRLNGIGRDNISNLLAGKHSKDVFISECKNGETWGARDLLKLDAWVLLRTYSPLTTIGYEIKCSRQDFEQDQKWTSYLDLCHSFYFVCPAGLIRAVDLPQRVGIIWVSGNNKLHTKRKAERVEPDATKLNHLLIYALMSRCKIVANMNEIYTEPQEDNLKLIREAIERASERKELAGFVKGHIRDIYDQTMEINYALKFREDNIKRFEGRLALLGITWDSKKNEWQDMMRIENEIDMLKKRIDYHTLNKMKATSGALADLIQMIEKYRSGGQA